MYNSHVGARKEMEKRRKISWAATAQVLAGGIAKSAHVLSTQILSSQQTKKRYFLLSGATAKIWMPSLGLLSLSLAMACGHRHGAATAARLFLCGIMGLLLRLEVIQGPELLPEKPLQLWKLIYRTAIWISVMVKCPWSNQQKNMSVAKHHNQTAAGLRQFSWPKFDSNLQFSFKLALQFSSFEHPASCGKHMFNHYLEICMNYRAS